MDFGYIIISLATKIPLYRTLVSHSLYRTDDNL